MKKKELTNKTIEMRYGIVKPPRENCNWRPSEIDKLENIMPKVLVLVNWQYCWRDRRWELSRSLTRWGIMMQPKSVDGTLNRKEYACAISVS